MTHLALTELNELSPTVTVPSYPLNEVSIGIVHFGVGAFHRAHQAMYVDRILSAGQSAWGICGVGVLPTDRTIGQVLKNQDYLYTLVTVDPNGSSHARVIGSVAEFLFAPDDPTAVQQRLTNPATKIVSLTITEGGYCIEDATGEFRPDGLTLADLQDVDYPSSVLGHIVAALRARRDTGVGPFTVVSCDNVQANGDVARRAILAFAERKDPAVAGWITQQVSFPNSMVDRITPGTTAETRQDVQSTFGVEDGWPVRSESFAQWVLEDRFCAGRPPLESVGVQLVDDVEPYELMKLRLLNASHQMMSYLGLLAGFTKVHEVCQDPLFVEFLLDYMRLEAVPTLADVPGIDLENYCHQLIERFASTAIEDTLARQVTDSSDRIPKFVLPVITAQLAAGRSVDRCAIVLAAWSLFLNGATEVAPRDRHLQELAKAATQEQVHPGSFLDLTLFGQLRTSRILREAFVNFRAALITDGPRAVMTNVGLIVA